MTHRVGLFMALLLIVAASVPVFAQGPLSDVPTDHWAYQAITKLAEQGVLEGYPDGTFKGNRSLTRYEFAVAIARMLDYGEEHWGKAAVGPAGKAGAPGPAGPAGPAGATAGTSLTEEQQKLLDQLKTEFAPELKEQSVMLDDLTNRVDALENAKPPMPKIKVSGSLDYRVGWYGTKLKPTSGETTGYPFAPFWIPEEYDGYPSVETTAARQPPYGAIYVSDSMKDAFKANDFGSLVTTVNISGDISDNASVFASLVAEPRTNNPDFDPDGDYYGYSPASAVQLGVMDIVRVDQAWVKYGTNWIMPAKWTVGKQYQGFGQGLLFNNNLFALKGVNADVMLGTKLGLTAFGAQVDREAFGAEDAAPLVPPGEDTWGQDTYLAGRLSLPIWNWEFGGNWLQTGFGDEQGYSIDGSGKIFGRPVAFEYATLLKSVGGVKASDWSDSDWLGVKDNKAFVVSAGLIDTSGVELSAKYGQIDPLYAFSVSDMNSKVEGFSEWWPGDSMFNLPLTLLHPYTEVSPHDINWVDRPLFLDVTNVSKGWEVNLAMKQLFGKDMPLKIRYYTGKAYCTDYLDWLQDGGENSGYDAPEKWTDADSAFTVSISKPVAQDVTATLLYGRRQVSNIMQPDPDFLQDPIQVVRGELSVAF